MKLGTNIDEFSIYCKIKLQGKPISPGLGYGRPCFSNIQKNKKTIGSDQKFSDITSHIKSTFEKLDKHLEKLAATTEERIDKNTADIFYAHQLILNDENLQTAVLNSVANRRDSAEKAIENCFNDYYDYFRKLNDQCVGDRGEIFLELKRLFLNLLGSTDFQVYCRDAEGCSIGNCKLGNDHILVTKELNADIVAKIRQHTRGIISEICGTNSHAAIIARALGIPVVSGIKDIDKIILKYANLLIDGDNGEIIIDPGHLLLDTLHDRINSSSILPNTIAPVPNLTVLADIDKCSDVDDAIKVDAEGIGLYRTEFEMLRAGRILNEEEQVDNLNKIAQGMHGKPVYIRLLDLGGDKSGAWLEIENEENPALGCRGARYLLLHPELIEMQARAIARISTHTPINVIYPMITTFKQFLQIKNIFMNAIEDINYGEIYHGIMFEIPSVCIEAEVLFEVIDFGRIGTNDLVQYLYAYDRTKDDFDFEETTRDPALWKLIWHLANIANKAGKPLEVCGGILNYPEWVSRLIDLGITTVSTYPKNIANVRKAASSKLSDINTVDVTH